MDTWASEDGQDTVNVLIDVDTGADDAIALIMAFNSPEIQISGITTVAGNARLTHTTRNTLRLASYLGHSDLPVSKGADRPLKGRFSFAYHYHGPGGITTRMPPTAARPVAVRAPEFINAAVGESGDDVTIIALGPLTNIARAIRRNPLLPDRVRRIFVMGGAVEVPGNVTPSAEFNVHSDPHAANVVFDSGIPTTLIGLDVGDAVGFDRGHTDWRSGRSRGEDLGARIIQGWFDIHPDRAQFVLCDPLTVAAAVAPDLFEYRQGTVTVDETGESKGRTRAEYGPGNVSIALNVDEGRAHSFVLERLRSAQG